MILAVLASQVSMIVQFFSQQTEARRTKWRQIYELKREQEATGIFNADEELVEEINFLKRLADQEDRLSRVYDLTLSLLGFVSFWMIGAAAYEAIEGWSFGNSVYYCYVTFFTIGFVSASHSIDRLASFTRLTYLFTSPGRLLADYGWRSVQNRFLTQEYYPDKGILCRTSLLHHLCSDCCSLDCLIRVRSSISLYFRDCQRSSAESTVSKPSLPSGRPIRTGG